MRKFHLLPLLLALFVTAPAIAQHIPSPKEHFGFAIGEDYKLANYTQSEAYFKKVAAASDRVKIEMAGTTSEGRNQYLIIISSPSNLSKLDTYKEISRKLAHAELAADVAKELVRQGKPVIWIDGGLHATETVATHQLMETCYQLASRNDPENLRILEDAIILLFHCNPDGQELVSNWYMQQPDTLKRNKRIPTLYHKYVGHDNNRDFYMNNLLETATMSRLQYIEWMPQIIYNHHQSGPPGSIVAGPPYRDPFNYVIDPMLITGIDGVAAAMINRLNAEDKPGYTRLSGSVFSTWWNGGLRTTPYYHNSIGILTEIVGDPTPMEIPLVPERLIPNNATPYPAAPGPWHFAEAIAYSVSLNYAILDYASRYGDELLYNRYKMGRNSIERGNADHWTAKPSMVNKIDGDYKTVFEDPALRDPRGFIIPADQPDFPRAIQFINALIKSGIQIHQATADFTIGSTSYPKGSYVVKTSQAFRPHVLNMFEPQDHPNDFQYPGGPPVRPYDAAGWTLAYQFGISFDRILDGFDGPFRPIPYGLLQIPVSATVPAAEGGYLLDARVNNSFIAVNKLLAAGKPVSRINRPESGLPAGSFFVGAAHRMDLQAAIDSLGVAPVAVATKPTGITDIKPRHIALFDYYGGSMPSGWVRWLLEQYRFDDFTVVYPEEIDQGGLIEKYDIILFIGGGIPPADNRGTKGRQPSNKADIPPAYHHMLGSITAGKSIPQLRKFAEAGGTLFAVGSSTALAYHLGLPVKNALVAPDSSGNEQSLSSTQFYAPASVHRVMADTTDPAGWGMPAAVDIMSSNSPVFKITDDGATIKKLAWYDGENPLRSGWIWGAGYLKNGVVAFHAPIGKGQLYAFGPEITFRAQPHGTFKWLFNQLYAEK
ncbi:M14 family metallopeptidase [Parapedobacter soli]|uniref:M14 family metallopeptidase n=1 Tax=Parapedobacter soli TaxID=416955 RepID=UPI0021CA0D89|nr:M14 family metallopeptidase [Parapedobacter soli]